MARIHGSKGSVEMGSPGVAIASLNSWTLNMRRDRVDVTAFQDTNKQYVQGLPDISGDLGGWYDAGAGSPDNGNLDLFDVAEGDTSVVLTLIPSTLASSNYWSGPAFLDASVSVSATGAVSISGSFVAAGAWARTP
jgi:hypothetical protein